MKFYTFFTHTPSVLSVMKPLPEFEEFKLGQITIGMAYDLNASNKSYKVSLMSTHDERLITRFIK